MRIGVDGYNLAIPHGTGIATYATELVVALHGMGHLVDGIFGLDVPAEISLRQAAFFDRYRRVSPPPRRRSRRQRLFQPHWERIRAHGPHPLREVPIDGTVATTDDGVASIPAFDRLFSAARLFDDAMRVFAQTGRFTSVRVPDPPAIMHWTYPLPVKMAGSRNIYTLHDLVPLKLPYTTLDDKRRYGLLIEGCLRYAAQVCTVSESSRRDIIDHYHLEEDRITNTYQSASRMSASATAGADRDAHDVESIFGLKRRGYFLYCGAIEPKKNVGRLIEAYLSLRTATPLVIVGARGWQSESELQLMPGGGADGGVGTFHGPRGQTIVRLDYLPRTLLAKLIRGATALVFPSLYEGFGLPVLEAMDLGTPVITSVISSLPEITGQAGLLVDPYKTEELIDAMRRLDTDKELGQSLAALGRKQADLFSIDRYQARLAGLYEAALASRRG